MGLLPDTQNCGLRMRRECRERFPRHRFQRKPLVSDPGMHHGTCVKHVPWCMSESLTDGGWENVPGIPGACATRNFAYLVRGPWTHGIHMKYDHDTTVLDMQENNTTMRKTHSSDMMLVLRAYYNIITLIFPVYSMKTGSSFPIIPCIDALCRVRDLLLRSK